MNRTDQYFTSTIVGQPVTLPLGAPVTGPAAGTLTGISPGALTIDLRNARPSLADHWRDWVLLRTEAPPGERWRRPGRLRRWLVRHSLWLGLLGWTLALALLAREHGSAVAQYLAADAVPWLGEHVQPVVLAALQSVQDAISGLIEHAMALLP